jgi:hypothetical protein
MMMWHGAHCGSSQAYFADKDVFEIADDLEKTTETIMLDREDRFALVQQHTFTI